MLVFTLGNNAPLADRSAAAAVRRALTEVASAGLLRRASATASTSVSTAPTVADAGATGLGTACVWSDSIGTNAAPANAKASAET